MKLEEQLILNKYFLNLFNFSDFNELREKLKDVAEGYDAAGRSYFAYALIGIKPNWESLIFRYDEAIRNYVERLRRERKEQNFNLKYFQYLAVLFTEIFLDKYYNERTEFLKDLNDFSEEIKNANKIEIEEITEKDIQKLAFWMATGSGKTLIMHINYFQILKYSKNNWDNIILITPNEGLSRQHYEELKMSGIPAKFYDGNIDNLNTRDKEILVIDIHKLTKEKKGEGVSVDISYFDGKNLVFIDEGHKGQKSDEQTWKKLREEIGKSGFLFEYSATFGQIIGKNKELLDEYSKAIIFNYSYKYFYTDGYGKDFYVYNLKSENSAKKVSYTEEQQNLLLVAGLLSFYEQIVIYENYKEELKNYNIEKPLWIFVGSKVTGKGVNSDVVKVIAFLDKITKDETYLLEKIEKILGENSGLIDSEGNDIFKGKFEYLKNEWDRSSLTEDIYLKVFNGKGQIELYEIKNAEGELGLKTSTAEKYFGIINVGDVRTLKKLISESEIEVKEDHFNQSLFFVINESNSYINILIGSKKFIEGWNSWRVSNMGLINMGKGEGPQIIQLFGRGVRLKGVNYSLKREENPDIKIKTLQTLFIFGLNADYINAFLKAIEKEEVDYREIEIPIKFNKRKDWDGEIYTIKTKDDFNFLNSPIQLTFEENILENVNIDLRPKLTMAKGLRVSSIDTATDEPLTIPDDYYDLIDWDYIYSEILNYKITNGFYNLILNYETLKNIIKSRAYKIFINETDGIKVEYNNKKAVLRLTSFFGIDKLNDLILTILKNYIVKFYRAEEKRETMNFLEAEPLTLKKHSTMFPDEEKIILKIPRKLSVEIEEILKELENYNPTNNQIPEKWEKWDSFVVHFDNHLYSPLILWKKNKEEIKSFPVKLNEGETKFVKDFKEFLTFHREVLDIDEIFLLRNLSKRGIGFFIKSGFYPDFIIWHKSKDKQHLIFIDPKGIRNLGNFNDDKIKFCTNYIKEIEKKIIEDLENKKVPTKLQLDGFILSISKYNEIKSTFGNGKHSKEQFKEHNIVFLEESFYIREIFKKVGIRFKN